MKVKKLKFGKAKALKIGGGSNIKAPSKANANSYGCGAKKRIAGFVKKFK